MNFANPAQIVALSTHTIFTVGGISAMAALTREELQHRVRLVLEDGSVVELRTKQLDQLWNAMHTPLSIQDNDWLLFTPAGVFFATQSATVLPLVVLEPVATNPTPNGRARSVRIDLGETAPAISSTPERMHIVIDQSGSMQNMQIAVYDGARELVQDLPDNAIVAFSTFSKSVRVGGSTTKASVMQQLSNPPLANGSTSLYDAIVDVTARETSGNATIVLLTDGQDTSSISDQAAARRACLAFQSNPTNRFLFLGSHQNAILSAEAFGIPVARALTFGNEETHMRAAMQSAARNVSRYRSLGADEFTHVERQTSATATF